MPKENREAEQAQNKQQATAAPKRTHKERRERRSNNNKQHGDRGRKNDGGLREAPKPRRPHPHQHPDYDYYLDRVLRPVADSILEQVDSSFDRALGHPTQLSLL